jgi:hypothetical protein
MARAAGGMDALGKYRLQGGAGDTAPFEAEAIVTSGHGRRFFSAYRRLPDCSPLFVMMLSSAATGRRVDATLDEPAELLAAVSSTMFKSFGDPAVRRLIEVEVEGPRAAQIRSIRILNAACTARGLAEGSGTGLRSLAAYD